MDTHPSLFQIEADFLYCVLGTRIEADCNVTVHVEGNSNL